MERRDTADELVRAFASSDLTTIDALCTDDVVVWGTDEGERWSSKLQVLAAFAGAFDLEVRWSTDPIVRDNWLTGELEFASAQGDPTHARVTLIFRGSQLAHAHYSIARLRPLV
jgi:ketosteroid isomerase-like protein